MCSIFIFCNCSFLVCKILFVLGVISHRVSLNYIVSQLLRFSSLEYIAFCCLVPFKFSIQYFMCYFIDRDRMALNFQYCDRPMIVARIWVTCFCIFCPRRVFWSLKMMSVSLLWLEKMSLICSKPPLKTRCCRYQLRQSTNRVCYVLRSMAQRWYKSLTKFIKTQARKKIAMEAAHFF